MCVPAQTHKPSSRTMNPSNTFFLATILQNRGFSAEFFGSAQEALAVARLKALGLLVANDTSPGDFGGNCATQMRMLTMNSGEEIEHSYHEERLLALLQRRHKLPATSNLMPDLEIQILAAWDLVRSCRMVQARLQLKAVLDLAEASGNHSPRLQVDNAIMCQADEILVKPIDKRALVNESRFLGGPSGIRQIESVATILGRTTDLAIQAWYEHVRGDELLMSISMDHEERCAAICVQSSTTSYVASNQLIRSIGRCRYHGMPLNTASTGDDKATVQ
jgi:hypothetical protein